MESKKLYSIRYTLQPKDIMTFVGGLHEIQSDMIEETVAIKERQGFPEATEVIDRIRALK
jgi:predicted Rdx family selenoprotein